MQKKIVAFYVGQLFIILSFFMLLPAGLAVFDKDKKAMFAYFASAGLSCLIGFALRYLGRKNNLQNFRITRREAFGIVALGWMSLGVMCGIPFLVEGSITHVASAIFEAVSGLTTTGATVIQDIEGLSRPLISGASFAIGSVGWGLLFFLWLSSLSWALAENIFLKQK